MPNVLVRDLPDDTHKKLQQRAEAAGQSLQQYLSRELIRLAETPTMEEVLERIHGRSGGRIGFTEAVEALEDERNRR
jgi:antitoxin FitA